jgi:hypothetical protein
MEQTFGDLVRERAGDKKRVFALGVWLFLETFAGIVRENMRVMTMTSIAARPTAYRFAIGIAAMGALLLMWFYGAVAEEGDSPGPLFFAVIAALVVGTVVARLRPRGMAYALMVTALMQLVFAAVAVISWGQYVEILAFNGFFVLLWVGSALLFWRAERVGAMRVNAER